MAPAVNIRGEIMERTRGTILSSSSMCHFNMFSRVIIGESGGSSRDTSEQNKRASKQRPKEAEEQLSNLLRQSSHTP